MGDVNEDLEADHEDVEESQEQSDFESVEPQANLEDLGKLVDDARSRLK